MLLHTDAAQSLGKVPVDVEDLGVDLLTVAGHKLYAPKGVGVLYVRRGVKLENCLHGAGHESGRRAGTENVPYVGGPGRGLPRSPAPRCRPPRKNSVRCAIACGLACAKDWANEWSSTAIRRDACPTRSTPTSSAISAASCWKRCPEIAASTGSACHEGLVTQSPVLCAMRVPPEIGRGALRLTVGRFSTQEEMDRAAEFLVRAARG